MPTAKDRALIRVMRTLSTVNIAVYRASRGRLMGHLGGLPVCLLTVPGRSTGLPRTTAVGYLLHEGRYVLTGSAGGTAAEPQWFRNLRATDRASIEVGAERIEVTVRVLPSAERDALWDKLVETAPGFRAYQRRTDREIPMAVLTPVTGS